MHIVLVQDLVNYLLVIIGYGYPGEMITVQEQFVLNTRTEL